MRARYVAVIALASALVAGLASPAGAATQPLGPAKAQCFGGGFTATKDDAATAKRVMQGYVTLSPHKAVKLPRNLTWKENPFKDRNWAFQLHTLRWADVLRREGMRTKNRAMLDRHREILADWLRDNPRSKSPSPFSWSDMATGLRAIAYSCAIGSYGYRDYLRTALRRHGQVLADPNFGQQRANHALHVRNGLLVAGCVLGNTTWKNLAQGRIDAILRNSVDAEGVIDEGSTSYHYANYVWYGEAERRIRACGRTPSATFERVRLMPEFLAHATAPDGTYEQIGDSDRGKATAIAASPTARYAATAGAEGTAPASLYQTYSRGYLFARSGWGTERPFADELFYSMRFGPSLNAQAHGHEDAGQLTLNAYGRKLLFDAGRYRYDYSDLTKYIKSRAAHNTVDVLGATYDRDARTELVTAQHTPGWDLTTVRVTALTGTTWLRTVLYSRTGGYLVVDDRLANAGDSTMVQRWNLPENGTESVGASSLTAEGAGADLSMFWVGSTPQLSVATGQQAPLLGWRGYSYGNAFAAPVAEARLTGATGRFTTVIVPRPDGMAADAAGVADAVVTEDDASLTVSVGGVRERVRFSTTDATVTPVTDEPAPSDSPSEAPAQPAVTRSEIDPATLD